MSVTRLRRWDVLKLLIFPSLRIPAGFRVEYLSLTSVTRPWSFLLTNQSGNTAQIKLVHKLKWMQTCSWNMRGDPRCMLICIWDKLTISAPAGDDVCHPSRLQFTCLSQLSWAKKSNIKFKFRQANQRGATKVMQDSLTYEWVNVYSMYIVNMWDIWSSKLWINQATV